MIHCSKEKLLEQTEELGLERPSSSTIDSYVPTFVYADIARSHEPDLGNHYANVEDSIEPPPDIVYAEILPSQDPPNNDRTDDISVIYAELLRKYNEVPTVTPPDDLYAKVKKRETLYPP